MSNLTIEFNHVWKKFKRGENFDSLRDLIPVLAKWAFSANSRQQLQKREFWAVQDVSFQLVRGEALGVIGPNGAGKSTILKLLSGILRPTRGEKRVFGRLSALIEVSAGFHPDLTGKENIYLNGAILGMTRKEIEQRLDEIIEFAGLRDFIDTPVKRYSSGMYARLGFSVAAHVNPEILLVDEVLSVGDMQFQQKCLERMQQVIGQGTTIIFVSHNLQAVQMLCPKTLYVEAGKMKKLGPTAEVIADYVCTPRNSDLTDDVDSYLQNAALFDSRGDSRISFRPGEKAQIQFELRCPVQPNECIVALILHRATDDLTICDYNLALERGGFSSPGILPVQIDFSVNLLRGTYVCSINVWHKPTANYLCRADRVLSFFVEEAESWQGVVHLEPTLQRTKQITSSTVGAAP